MKPKQPLFHVVKRDHVSRSQLVLAYVLAVVIAVAVGAVLLTVMGVPFGAFYQKMFTLGLLDNKFAYKNVENFIKPRLDIENQPMYDAYNTYACVGLPVGPICSPGLDAIDAALYPDSSDYFYFLTDKNGKYYYAQTGEEHYRNEREAESVGGVDHGTDTQ